MNRLIKVLAVFAITSTLVFAENRQLKKPVAPTGTKTQETAASGCALLPASQIEKVLGQPFNAPAESKFPPAFGDKPWGSNCQYSSKTGRTTVVFIVYVDASPQEAKQTFDRLLMWFPATSKPSGIGDSAYIDRDGAIHVLKDKVRYFLSIDPKNEGQLKNLAAALAERL
jgi:hypothetical protein